MDDRGRDRPVGARRTVDVVNRIYRASQLLVAGILLAFIIGSLLFTGGQVLDDGERIYREAWRWPVFPVPAWLLIIPGVISAGLVVPLVVLTRAADAEGLIGHWGQSIVTVGTGVLFAFAFPASSGLLPVPDDPGKYLGQHWVAAALFAFCFVVLVLGMLIKLPAYERLRKAGTLPDRSQ